MAYDVKVEISATQPNLAKLLVQKRVELDDDGRVKNPQNNVLYIKEVPITVTDSKGRKTVLPGQVQKIPVNGGHVRAYNPITGKQTSVWRIALRGPTKYHSLLIRQAEVRRKKGTMEQVAPDLEDIESDEYILFLDFLKDADYNIGSKLSEEDRDEIDLAFAKWLKKSNSKVAPVKVAAPKKTVKA